MTKNDRSPPTRGMQHPTIAASTGPRAADFDPALGITERDLHLLDAYYHERAIDASEDPRPNTEEEQAADDALLAAMRATMSSASSASKARARRG